MTFQGSGFVNGDTAASLSTQPTVTTAATPASPVGTYSITASGAVDADYTITYVGGTLSVTAVPLTITANNQTTAYGSALPTLTFQGSGFVNGDTAASLSTQPTVATTATSASNVGSYNITASGAVDPNYTITYVSGTLGVTAVPLTITANNKTMAYGGAVPTLTFQGSGFVNGDTAASLSTQPTISTTATSASNVGSYNITASGAVDPNYTITYVSGTLSVTAAPLTITANNQTKAYGSALPALTFQGSGFVNGDTAASLSTQPTISTTATSASQVGSYSIAASGAVDANYTITYVGGTLSVTAAPLTITANNQTMAYGGTVPTLTFQGSGFVNGDTAASLSTQPTISTTATSASQVGSYSIAASGAVDANYTITYVGGTLSVTAAPLTITANNQTMAYGGTVPTLTFQGSGFVNGDTAASLSTQPTISTTATSASQAGTYSITASGAVDANYTITYVGGTLTITPPPAPATPVLVGPGSSASPGPTLIGTAPTFQWDQATNATSYTLYVKDVTAGTAAKTYTISNGSTTSDAIGLMAGHTYGWNMCACDGSAMSPLSTEQYFTIHAAPGPNPILWAAPPHATSATSISMTAATASDASGVQYYFRCLTTGGHSSAWQTSPTYQDTGLSPGTYTYEVKTRDESANHNQGNYSIAASATTPATTIAAPVLVSPGSSAGPGPTVIGTAPTFKWNQVSNATSYLLYVQDVTAGTGAVTYTISSGSTTSDAVGLTAGHAYAWNVCAYAGSAESLLSKTYYFTIPAPPSPNPIAWAKPPYPASTTSIGMTAETATDASGVQYYFRCLTPGGHSSAWQASPTYQDTGLSPGTTYTYEVKTRDDSSNHNQGNYSASASATTLSGAVGDTIANGVGTDAILNDDALQTAVVRPMLTTSQAADANDAALAKFARPHRPRRVRPPQGLPAPRIRRRLPS